MPTRRSLLKGTALSLIGSTFPVSVMAIRLPRARLNIVYETGITESVAFKDTLKRNASRIHILKQDPMETFRQLSDALLTDSIILGRTRGAAAFVLGELAREHGGKMEIFGEHRCPDYLVTWGILP